MLNSNLKKKSRKQLIEEDESEKRGTKNVTDTSEALMLDDPSPFV